MTAGPGGRTARPICCASPAPSPPRSAVCSGCPPPCPGRWGWTTKRSWPGQRVAERRRRLDDLPQQAGGAAVQDDPALTRTAARAGPGPSGAGPGPGPSGRFGRPSRPVRPPGAASTAAGAAAAGAPGPHPGPVRTGAGQRPAAGAVFPRPEPAGRGVSLPAHRAALPPGVLHSGAGGSAATADDLSPRSALSLSRGTADQLYLSLRLAVCRLCLPEKPPIVLDDALAAFDGPAPGVCAGPAPGAGRGAADPSLHLPPAEGTLLAGDPAVKQLTLQT